MSKKHFFYKFRKKMYWYCSFIIHLKHCWVNNKKYIIQEKVVQSKFVKIKVKVCKPSGYYFLFFFFGEHLYPELQNRASENKSKLITWSYLMWSLLILKTILNPTHQASLLHYISIHKRNQGNTAILTTWVVPHYSMWNTGVAVKVLNTT